MENNIWSQNFNTIDYCNQIRNKFFLKVIILK